MSVNATSPKKKPGQQNRRETFNFPRTIGSERLAPLSNLCGFQNSPVRFAVLEKKRRRPQSVSRWPGRPGYHVAFQEHTSWSRSRQDWPPIGGFGRRAKKGVTFAAGVLGSGDWWGVEARRRYNAIFTHRVASRSRGCGNTPPLRREYRVSHVEALPTSRHHAQGNRTKMGCLRRVA